MSARKVLLVRSGSDIFAIDAHCSDYHGPLAEIGGRRERPLPLASRCFDLRTGKQRAPGSNPPRGLAVEQDGKASSSGQSAGNRRRGKRRPSRPGRILIVGGAAGFAAADAAAAGISRQHRDAEQRCRAAGGSAEPVKRLSRRQRAEIAAAAASRQFLHRSRIELRLNTDVTSIDTKERNVIIAGGETISYDRLLLATGAEPVRLPIPGADRPHVHVLRTLADCRAIVESAKRARRAIVIGASFIGLEAAASLRARKIEVHVVGLEARPMERVLGPEMGDFIRARTRSTASSSGDTVVAIEGSARPESGAVLEAELVVVGVGVRPRLALAEKAGLELDRGIAVNAYLETSVPGIYAAGDIARWPDPHSRENIRVEHWVVAERQGQVAARNMLGQKEAFDAVPFFWSQHYDVPINYVGHAETWDEIAVDGDIAAKDCLLQYKRHGRVLAVASIYRDLASLKAELQMEQATP
jgi:NADPH-dependent 2,4-dienoyl-CoA reductase/sulfur reductase-like enzyme